jgi:hypothetical protein
MNKRDLESLLGKDIVRVGLVGSAESAKLLAVERPRISRWKDTGSRTCCGCARRWRTARSVRSRGSRWSRASCSRRRRPRRSAASTSRRSGVGGAPGRSRSRSSSWPLGRCGSRTPSARSVLRVRSTPDVTRRTLRHICPASAAECSTLPRRLSFDQEVAPTTNPCWLAL